MSFTVRCNNCGNEVVFNDKDTRKGDVIQVIPDVRWGYTGYEVDGVDFYCENDKCNNSVLVK